MRQVLFRARFWSGIADGSVTLAFRRWAVPRVVVGRRHRVAGGMIEIDDVREVDPDAITAEDATRAGYSDVSALVNDLRDNPEHPVHRIEFHHAGADPRTALAADGELTESELAMLDTRLARLDRASSHGPWTSATLELIAARPAVRAGDLAAEMGREREPFKLDVRKLKNLGLTTSLEIGYELSVRGAAYLRARARPPEGPS